LKSGSKARRAVTATEGLRDGGARGSSKAKNPRTVEVKDLQSGDVTA
jgi:hypothetical protein